MTQTTHHTRSLYHRETDTKVDAGWGVKHGLIGGALAGVVFAMGQMLFAWLSAGNPFAPLHMIASIPLQQAPPTIDTPTAVFVGVVTHMLYAMLLGEVVALIAGAADTLRRTRAATVLFATAIGFISWPLNFYVLAPNINAPWFAVQTKPLWQFIAHTFLYGSALGLYLASRLHTHDDAAR